MIKSVSTAPFCVALICCSLPWHGAAAAGFVKDRRGLAWSAAAGVNLYGNDSCCRNCGAPLG